jgi:23S rRNA maturation-related 3'-5' exoribonuclease YhaM
VPDNNRYNTEGSRKCAAASASDFYTNMIKEVGLDSPFEPGCVKNIVEKLEKYVK